MINVRDASVRILSEIETHDRFSNKILQEYSKAEISEEDKRLLRELVYGVLENKLYIDKIIKTASSVKMRKIHPMILQILRISVYQLVFMDRIPARAAINEAVNLAKKYGHKGTIGYVNGVLRTIHRDMDYFTMQNNPDNKVDLAMRYSHPKFMIDLWVEQYGFDFASKLVKYNNTRPILNIRVNTIKIDRESLMIKLQNKGLNLEKGKLSSDCLIVLNPESITSLNEFREGLFTIQDESSMMVAEIANPIEGNLVIDVCSAPGGKTTHMAQKMNNRGKIIARDLYKQKIELIIETNNRLGIDIIETQVYDALIFDKDYENKADICLVDAPCSGFGIIRRKPDIKFNRNIEDLKSLMDIQFKILNTSAGYVKPGGKLIYSTCTINKEENINQVEKFLTLNPQFHLSPIELSNETTLSDTQQKGFVELYPHIHGTDGFFIANMVRE